MIYMKSTCYKIYTQCILAVILVIILSPVLLPILWNTYIIILMRFILEISIHGKHNETLRVNKLVVLH